MEIGRIVVIATTIAVTAIITTTTTTITIVTTIITVGSRTSASTRRCTESRTCRQRLHVGTPSPPTKSFPIKSS